MKKFILLLAVMLLSSLAVVSANYSNSLLSYWSFDDSTVNTTNATGSGNTASGYWVGTVPTKISSCILGGCVQFNATTSFLNISRGFMQDASDNTYTMSAWIYPTSTSGVWAGTQNGGVNGVNAFLDSTPKVFLNKGGVINLDYNFAYQNKWTHLVFVQNTTGMYWYANGSLVASNTNTANFAVSTSDSASIARRINGVASDQQYYGFIDEIAFWGRALNGTEVSALYNSGAGYNPFTTVDTSGSIFINSSSYGSYRLTNYSLLFTGENSTLNASFPFNLTTPTYANWTFLSEGQFTPLCIQTSYGFTINGSSFDSVFTLNKTNSSILPVGSYALSGVSLDCGITRSVTLDLDANLYSTTNGTIYISASNLTQFVSRNFTLYSYSPTAHFNRSYINHNLSANLTFNYTVLVLNGTDYVTNYPVNNYSITLNSTNNSNQPSTQTAINQTAYFYTYHNLSLFGYYAKSGYISNSTTFTSLSDGIINRTIYFYPNNSVLFSIFNATNLVPTSGQLIDVALTGSGNNTYASSTSNGTLFFEGLAPDTYTIDAQGSGYGSFTGLVVVGANTFQTYQIYMPQLSSTNTVFTVFDYSGGDAIAGAELVVEYKPLINSSFVNVGSYTSDVTGSILLYYVAGAHYRFTLSASGYQTRQFELDPIIFATYDITLTRNVTSNITDDFDGITITLAPSIIYNNQVNNITFYIATPLGNLQGFNYSIWTDYNSTPVTGLTTNAYGDTLTVPYYVNATARMQNVYISYTYFLTSGTTKTYTRVYPIIDFNLYTFSQIRDAQYYGLSLFDRILILMFTLLIGAGFAYAFGGEFVGGFIAVAIFVYFTSIGFIPLWFSAISSFIILWFLWGRQ